MDFKDIIDSAIAEDIGSGDITSDNVILKQKKALGIITSREPGIICGLNVSKEVCNSISGSLSFITKLKDGDFVKKNEVIAHIKGNAQSVLAAERIILNFITFMSGIATVANKFVNKTRKYNVTILDTRKTVPGLRQLQKYAVAVGGAKNHRMGLYDLVLIKDNHIKLAGSIKDAVERVKELNTEIEVECKTLAQVKEAVQCSVDRIMLDNMDIALLKKSVRLINKRCKIEVSGGITLDNVERIAKLGIDYISVGALTHSFKSLDLSMEVE